MRWHRHLVFAACAAGLSGAAVAQPKELLALKGQPVQPVIARLGAPESQTQSANGATIYVWVVKSMVNMPTRTTRTEYATGIANTYESVELRPQLTPCTLRLAANAAGTITDVEPKGEFPACSAVADKLAGRN